MISILRKLLFRIFLGSVFLVGIMILANRIFAGIYTGRILWAERGVWWPTATVISIVMIILFAIVFPVIYIRHLKLTVLGKAVATIWSEYRDEFVETIVSRAVGTVFTIKQKWQHLVSGAIDIYSGLPMMVRRVVEYIKNKIPLIEQVQESLDDVDRDKISSPEQAQELVMQTLQTKLSKKLPEDTYSSIWWIVLLNLVCAGIVIYLT